MCAVPIATPLSRGCCRMTIRVRVSIVVSAWQRQLALERIGDAPFGEFVERQLGRVSETAPEAGVSCAGAIGAPPFDPDRNYDDAEQFFMEN